MTEFDRQFGEDLEAALPLMKRAVCYYSDRPDERDDIVQDTALLAWKHRGQFQGTAHLNAWVLRILRNVAASLRRRQRLNARPWDQQLVEGFDMVDRRGRPADEMLLSNEVRAAVEKRILELPKGMQAGLRITLDPLRRRPLTITERGQYLRAVIVLRAKFQQVAA
jgi:DNA-directed RNA polymerase specialized sigma24 family protein